MKGYILSCTDGVPIKGKSGPRLEEVLMMFTEHFLCLCRYKKVLV